MRYSLQGDGSIGYTTWVYLVRGDHMIYVDNAYIRHRGGRYCHLLSDTSLAELIEFGELIGLKRGWMHSDHFDVNDRFRGLAVDAGARQCGVKEMIQIRKLYQARMAQRSLARNIEDLFGAYEFWATGTIELDHDAKIRALKTLVELKSIYQPSVAMVKFLEEHFND